jgi:CRP-like cAMP-binding protein
MSIEGTYLFQGVGKDTLKRISEMANEEGHAAGTFLFHAGDPAEYLYILEAGRVRLRVGEQGYVAYVFSAPGEVIGWSSMVEQEQYSSSAECIVSVKVTKIDKNALLPLLEKDAPSGSTFFRHLASIIGRRLINCYRATVSVHGERDPHSYG